MGSTGIFITGQGGLVERVTADSNAGGGFLIAGSVIESTATRNGTFGIFAIIVRDSFATDNHEVGIQLDSSGGVATGNIASFNGPTGFRRQTAPSPATQPSEIIPSEFRPSVRVASSATPWFPTRSEA